MRMKSKGVSNVVRNVVLSILWTVMLFGVPSKSFAFDEWSTRDYTLQATWTVLHIVDWGQTLDTAKNPDRFYEKNPLMGEHPSVSRVNTFMALGAVINPLFIHVLPSKWRPYFQAVFIAEKVYCVGNNYRIGLHVNF